jgi:hypothetical protein
LAALLFIDDIPVILDFLRPSIKKKLKKYGTAASFCVILNLPITHIVRPDRVPGPDQLWVLLDAVVVRGITACASREFTKMKF